jgi:hypothetical protein
MKMIKKEFGKKKYLKLREAFDKEDRDFTPWLNDHLDELSEELDLDLIDSTIEQSVGDFSCDIIAKDSNTNQLVIIENQFGTTDHDHLGKIFTYGAGKDAKVVIWIAEKFREEHQKTLEWLNENIDPTSNLSFFGIEVKLHQIDDSKFTADFDIVVKPNDWQRKFKASSSQSISETEKKYENFYSKLIPAYSKLNPTWRKIKPLAQSWNGFGAGRSGLAFNWCFKSNNRIAIELYIDTGDKNENERIFEELKRNTSEIELKIKGISWEKLEDKRACRIAVYKNIGNPIKTLPESEYPKVIEWAATSMKLFTDTLSPYIKEL